MALYETVFIARQDLSPSQVEALTEKFSSTLKANGGMVGKVEQWGLRPLAYRIKKNGKGHYVLLNVEGSASAVSEMERTMRLSEDVLRFLTVRVDVHEAEPSAPLRHSSDSFEEGDSFSPRPPRGAYRSRPSTPLESDEEITIEDTL